MNQLQLPLMQDIHSIKYKSYHIYFFNFYKRMEYFQSLFNCYRISSKSAILRYHAPLFNRIETLLFSHCPNFHFQMERSTFLNPSSFNRNVTAPLEQQIPPCGTEEISGGASTV